jgi:hypothetical protein
MWKLINFYSLIKKQPKEIKFQKKKKNIKRNVTNEKKKKKTLS